MKRHAVAIAVVLLAGGFAPAAMNPENVGGGPPEFNVELSRKVTAGAGSSESPVLFCIGIHVEPHGAKVSGLTGQVVAEVVGLPPGALPPGLTGSPPGPRGNLPLLPPPNYNDKPYFQRTVEDLGILAQMAERRGGKLSVQVQTPFTRVAAESKAPILADLEKRGHEVCLHFHEDAHLGRNCERLPAATWTAVMKEEIDYIKKAGAQKVRYWSGGNLFAGVLDAAAAAGLDVFSDHKNPRVQQSDPRLMTVTPWRPAGGPTADDLDAFARHDPKGRIVYLPVGAYTTADYASLKRGRGPQADAQYFDFMTESLDRSLRAARKDRVNVFHITVHPGEFRGNPRQPYGIIEKWLTEIVDPLAKTGKVRWATFSEMADAYAAWEKAHPGADPRTGESAPPAPAQGALSPRGQVTFVVNVHDTRHAGESAETVRRAVAIFTKYGVRGEFYLTAPMTEVYAAEQPGIIKLLKDTHQTISYHVRPPHPIYAGFEGPLKGLDDAALAAALKDYETYRQDPATGGLDREKPGGYAYVAQVFGCKPVSIGAPTGDPRIRRAAMGVYRGLGARMIVQYHERGTRPDQPYERVEGLLVRPSDFSITRWAMPGEREESFWWNRLDSPQAAAYNPTLRLKSELAAWKGPRPPFITALIHESDFARPGPVSWTAVYYGPGEGHPPRDPPFPLDTPDRSRPRSDESREGIWRAYEELVAYAAANLRVVTSENIVAMAAQATKN